MGVLTFRFSWWRELIACPELAGIPVFGEGLHGQRLLALDFIKLVFCRELQVLELLCALITLAQKFLERAKRVSGELTFGLLVKIFEGLWRGVQVVIGVLD